MNDFFNTTNNETYTIRTTTGDFTFTAMDIAKVVAFGERYIAWDGANTWISAEAVADMLGTFCTEEGEERGQLRDDLREKADIYSSSKDEALQAIIYAARDILSVWGNAKLYTCLRKNADGESKYIDLDKLEAMLGIDLGDTVRERLSYVTASKTDEEWCFDSATGRAFRETATIGILTEVRDAVQLFPTVLKHCIGYAKQGLRTFEEMAAESYSIDIERMTQSDIDDLKQAIADADVQPDRYSVYLTKHNDFHISVTEEVTERWDFDQELANFATRQEAVDFRNAANANYRIQKKRVKLAQQIADTAEQLQLLQAEFEEINS